MPTIAPEIFEEQIAKVWSNDVRAVFTNALEALQISPQSASSISMDAIEALKAMAPPAQSAAPAADPADLLSARRFNHASPPPAERTVYRLGDIEVSTAGNLTAISSPPKTGKSAVIGSMAASAMDCGDAGDTLSFGSSNPDGAALLWFDSEQSPFAFWTCVQRALKRAGRPEPPPWFYAYCLTGLGHEAAWNCVQTAIETASDKCGKLHSILLDGAADFVANVNDPEEVNDFVAELHGLAIDHACPIASVIHFNPGSEKTRGHLGSQLERKAESNLRLDKDANDVTEIWSNKQRGRPITKGTGPRFQWSDLNGMHMSVERLANTRSTEEKEELTMLAGDMFLTHKERPYCDLVFGIKQALKTSLPTAKRRVSLMSRLGIIKKNNAGLWTITT